MLTRFDPRALLLGVALTAACSQAPAPETDIAPINELRNQFQTAYNAGDAAAVARIQSHGLGRDTLRSLVLTGIGLVFAWAARSSPPLGERGTMLLDTVIIGAALASATSGALRLSGRGRAIRWLALGLAGGVGVILFR